MLTLSKTTSVPVKEVPGLGHLDDTLLHLVHRDPLVLVHVEQEPHLTRVRITVIMIFILIRIKVIQFLFLILSRKKLFA